MDSQCDICGSKFASRQCYFCQRKICTSCIVPEDATGNYSTIKCITCGRRKINKISLLSVLKRNKIILGIIAGFWIYTVFPIPFLQLFGIKIDPTSFQPIFITTAVMTIPFLFMFFAWQKRSPNSSQSAVKWILSTYQWYPRSWTNESGYLYAAPSVPWVMLMIIQCSDSRYVAQFLFGSNTISKL